MKAAVIEDFGQPLAIQDVAEPEVSRDGVVIEVRACGVCRSDWHGWKGANKVVNLPHVPGHELAGVVLEAGPDCRRFKAGDRVTVPVILGCGRCHHCRAGNLTVCDDQYVVGFSGWGAFAERVAIPLADANVLRLPEALPDEVAAALGCRTTTAFSAVVDKARVKPGEALAVHGCGGVGLSAVMIGAALGATVVAVDIVEEKLELARQIGATHTVNAARTNDVGEAIRDLTGGGAQASIEALGRTETFHNSLRCLAKLGRHVQIGQPLDEHANPPIPLLETVYYRQLVIMGSRGLSALRFPALFEMIAAGRLNIEKLIKNRIALEGATAVLQQMDRHEDVGISLIERF